MSPTTAFVTGCAVGAGTVIGLLLCVRIVAPWLRLLTSGGKGSFCHVVGMRLRGNPPFLIIDAYLSLLHSGEEITLRELESHYIANRTRVMNSEDLVRSMQRGGNATTRST